MRFRPRAALAFLLSTACADEEAGLPVEPAPEALFGGCDEFSGSVCTLDGDRDVGVWVDVHAATPLLVLADGKPIRSTGRLVQGGVLLAFDVPDDARSIRVESIDVQWQPPVEITVVREPPAKIGKDPTVEHLRSLVATTTGWQQLRALDALRRVLQQNGDPTVLEVGARELALAEQLGAPKHQTYVLGSQAKWFIDAEDPLMGRQVLEGFAGLIDQNPFARARWHYFEGVLGRRTDDLAAALEHLTSARVLYEKLGDRAVLEPMEMEAVTLAELGRADDARRTAERAFSGELSANLSCADRVRRINNFGWMELVLAQADIAIGDPRPALEEGLRLLPTCYEAWDETSLLISLALAEHQEGRDETALGWLSRVFYVDSYLRPWLEEAHDYASVGVGEGPSLLKTPIPVSSAQLRWNQTVRQAEALAAWGFLDLATRAYEESEALLAESANRVGIDPSVSLFLASRRASLDGLLDVLLRSSDIERAACAIRLARARELARIDRVARIGAASPKARDEWSTTVLEIANEQRSIEAQRVRLWSLSVPEQATQRVRLDARSRAVQSRLDRALRGLGIEPTPTTCEELRKPEAGEVILVVYDSLAFSIHATGVETAPLERLSDLDTLGDAALISVVEAGDRPDIPIHAMQWRDGKRLLELAPVAYSLDLRSRPALEPKDRVVIVANPREDLPLAREEGLEVQATLEGRGTPMTMLEGAQAQRASLLAVLPNVGLLHYAGHGVREGLSGWDSALLLADDQTLRVPDVLTLPRAPDGIVLTGCETAAATPGTIGGGMNIARAFILSGSRWVIAADDEIPDEYAAAVGVAVHKVEGDGPQRLRRSLLDLERDDPDAPWQHFRVITP